jgi:hypothetical protein
MTSQVVPEVRRSIRTVDLSKEQEWLAQHEKEYIGEWVVLDGDRLVGHGADPRPIVAEARLAGVQSPFVHFVAANSDPFMGGWV